MACCVDAAAANFPPVHAAFAASDASILGPMVPLSGATNVEGSHWSPSLSAALYKVDGWGAPYFAVNASGNISVRPHGTATMAHQEIDLMKIVKKVSDPKHSGGLGLQLPLIVRLPDVLKNRLESLQSAFEFAVGGPGVQGPLSGRVPGEVQPGPVRGGGHSEIRVAVSIRVGGWVEAGAPLGDELLVQR